MLSMNGLLMNCFMGNEFIDTKTGVITPATRFIPTDAGNTVAELGSDESQPVHPHRRGEHNTDN